MGVAMGDAKRTNDPKWLEERAILVARNDTVDRINFNLLQALPGQKKVYKSFDSTLEQSDAVQYPIEFLNSLKPSGMPPHCLQLKV